MTANVLLLIFEISFLHFHSKEDVRWYTYHIVPQDCAFACPCTHAVIQAYKFLLMKLQINYLHCVCPSLSHLPHSLPLSLLLSLFCLMTSYILVYHERCYISPPALSSYQPRCRPPPVRTGVCESDYSSLPSPLHRRVTHTHTNSHTSALDMHLHLKHH